MNKEISAAEAAILRANHQQAVLLDVREHDELAICHIEGALHIPMGEIPERHEALSKESPLLVFCHHGMRSMQVVNFLAAKGYDKAVSIAGGIHAWAIEIDTSLRRY